MRAATIGTLMTAGGGLGRAIVASPAALALYNELWWGAKAAAGTARNATNGAGAVSRGVACFGTARNATASVGRVGIVVRLATSTARTGDRGAGAIGRLVQVSAASARTGDRAPGAAEVIPNTAISLAPVLTGDVALGRVEVVRFADRLRGAWATTATAVVWAEELAPEPAGYGRRL